MQDEQSTGFRAFFPTLLFHLRNCFCPDLCHPLNSYLLYAFVGSSDLSLLAGGHFGIRDFLAAMGAAIESLNEVKRLRAFLSSLDYPGVGRSEGPDQFKVTKCYRE